MVGSTNTGVHDCGEEEHDHQGGLVCRYPFRDVFALESRHFAVRVKLRFGSETTNC